MLGGRRGAGGRFGLSLVSKGERPTEEGPLRRWVSVGRVEAGSAAAEAGVKADDIIEQVADVPVANAIDFERGFLDRTGKHQAEGPSRLGQLRGGVRRVGGHRSKGVIFQVVDGGGLGKFGAKATAVGAAWVQGVDKQLRGGLLLTDVTAAGLAGKAGLQNDDILLGLHQWETLSPDNVTYVLTHKDLGTFNPMRVIFIRGGKIRETTLTVD